MITAETSKRAAGSFAPLAVPWLGSFLVSLDADRAEHCVAHDLFSFSRGPFCGMLGFLGLPAHAGGFFTLVVGYVSERFGYRGLWLTGFCLFGGASICCALSEGILLLPSSGGSKGSGDRSLCHGSCDHPEPPPGSRPIPCLRDLLHCLFRGHLYRTGGRGIRSRASGVAVDLRHEPAVLRPGNSHAGRLPRETRRATPDGAI